MGGRGSRNFEGKSRKLEERKREGLRQGERDWEREREEYLDSNNSGLQPALRISLACASLEC